MGCLSSKQSHEILPPSSPKKGTPKKGGGVGSPGGEKKEYSWDKQKAALNPEDFIIKKLVGQTVVKEPGTINGQQFMIEDCEDCDIFICDYSASVTVDNCTNCRFFIGPVEDSIFVRDCKNCKCIVACKQWRTRDCFELDVLLYSKTQPIIESSNKMRFECFQYHYPSLLEQFNNAKLNVLSNDWSNIYDFTPGENHWTYLPKEEANLSTFLKPLPAAVLPASSSVRASVVPLTWGNRPKPTSKSILVVFFSDHKDKVVEFCNAATRDGVVIMQLTEKEISADVLAGVDASRLKKVNGEEALAVSQKNSSKYGADVVFVSPSLEAAHEQIGKIFEQVSIEI